MKNGYHKPCEHLGGDGRTRQKLAQREEGSRGNCRRVRNCSADAEADATNYVAPLGVFGLKFDEPFRYAYYLTAGSVDEIRNTFRSVDPPRGGKF